MVIPIKIGRHTFIKTCPNCGSYVKIIDEYIKDTIWIVHLPLNKKFSKKYPGLIDIKGMIFITYEGASHGMGKPNPIIQWSVLAEAEDFREIEKFVKETIYKPYRESIFLEDVDRYFEEVFKDIKKMEEVEIRETKEVLVSEIPSKVVYAPPSPPTPSLEIKEKKSLPTEKKEKKIDVSQIPIEEIRREIEAYKASEKKDFDINAFLIKCDAAKIKLGRKLGKREEEMDRIAYALLKGIYKPKDAYKKLYELLPELKEKVS